MADARDERRATLDDIIEIIKRERDPDPELAAECRDVLERCLFDKETALAVLRGEHELDDEPWSRCPECDCDTYFQFPITLPFGGGPFPLPFGLMVMFVCEGCQHTVMRARASMYEGKWWERGTRMRARPEDIGHPYRGDAVDPDDEDDDEDDDDDAAVVEPARVDDSQPVDWGDRKICPDGACIGIIRPGPDGEEGTCSVCGRTDQPAS